MLATRELVDSFHQYAVEQLRNGSVSPTIDELYDKWRESHPMHEDILAVQASLRDMASGETGRTIQEFDQEFRHRNGIEYTSE